MDASIIITGGIGILTTVVSSSLSWLLARKKFNVEVDASEIDNLKKALDFYEKIVQDNNQKLEEYIRITKENRLIVYKLQSAMYELLNDACLDKKCTVRKFYTNEQLDELMLSIRDTNTKKPVNKNKDNV